MYSSKDLTELNDRLNDGELGGDGIREWPNLVGELIESHLAAIARLESPWIAVETLPEPGRYLCSVATDYEQEIHVLDLDSMGHWIYEGEPTFCQTCYFEPTHYQRLPAPPPIDRAQGEISDYERIQEEQQRDGTYEQIDLRP